MLAKVLAILWSALALVCLLIMGLGGCLPKVPEDEEEIQRWKDTH